MKELRIGLGKCLILAGLMAGAWCALPVRALSTVPYAPPPIQSSAPVIITGYGFNGTDVTYVQLFNKSDEIVNLSGWHLDYLRVSSGEPRLLTELDGLLKPSSYVVAADAGVIAGTDYSYVNDTSSDTAPIISLPLLRLVPAPEYKAEEIKLPIKQETSYWRRNISDSTGNYLSTFMSFIPTANDTLYGYGLYTFPDETGLQVSEVMANPRDCSPVDVAADCHDYVKLYNPTAQDIDLSLFRLRSGYQGQSATATNTFAMSGVLQSGHYLSLSLTADDHTLSLTNSGGYVWLEDTYGIKLYDQTVQSYADASSDSHKGQAWAYDSADGNWKWTSQPTPSDQPSIFPVGVVVAAETEVETGLTPCQPDQYRSPDTNRCRLIPVPTMAVLAACSAGQYRSPETNRCRTIETASSLMPCAANQERNVATNRCRSIVSSESTLTPCASNQERNPDTNRCRNKTASSTSATMPFPVEPAIKGAASFAGWWLLGGVTALAAAYGIFEWRFELLAAWHRLVRRFPFVH